MALGPTRTLEHGEIEIGPDDRIAVTGPNGCGKSTLVRHIVDSLSLPEGQVVYMPQEIDADQAREIVASMPSVLNLATAAKLGLADPANIASNVMSGFGIEATESARVADVLAKSAASSNTDVQQLGIESEQLVEKVAPIAYENLVRIVCFFV